MLTSPPARYAAMSEIFENGLRNEMPDLQTVGLCLQTVRHRSTNCPTNFSIVPTNRHYCMRTYLIQNTLNTVCRVCRNSPTVCRTVCRTVCTDMNTVCRATPSRGHRRPRLAHAPDHAGPEGVKAGKRAAQWHLRAGEARRVEGECGRRSWTN